MKQLNGFTLSDCVSNIRYIIPDSCLKFVKLNGKANFSGAKIPESEDDLFEERNQAILNWIEHSRISNKTKNQLWGIIKTDKPSKFDNGKMEFTSYQMLNTIGFEADTAREFLEPLTDRIKKMAQKDEEGFQCVKDYLNNWYFSSGEGSSRDEDTFRIYHYDEAVAQKLLNLNCKYYVYSKHYNKVVKKLIYNIFNQVREGRVAIEGCYATLFCNGIELLKYAVDRDYKPGDIISVKLNGSEQVLPVLKGDQVYSKRFNHNETLMCARNPHITMGNYYLPVNTKRSIEGDGKKFLYDYYFDLSPEIICVNAIDSNIMQTLNGCDFDSDTMLISNNKTIVSILKNQSERYRVPFFSPENEGAVKKNEDESDVEFLAKIDDILANNKIGTIVNRSQRLNSLMWMVSPISSWDRTVRGYNDWFNKSGGHDIYTECCCKLAILSNIEIDKAKRISKVNVEEELARIEEAVKNGVSKEAAKEEGKRLYNYTKWISSPKSYTVPLFDFKNEYVHETSEDILNKLQPQKIYGRKILGLDPMGYLIQEITNCKATTALSSEGLMTDYDLYKNILKSLGLSEEKVNGNCSKSLNEVLSLLSDAFYFVNGINQKNNSGSEKTKVEKNAYIVACQKIIECADSINRKLNDDKTLTNPLLISLLPLFDENSRLVKTEDKYKIVPKSRLEFVGDRAILKEEKTDSDVIVVKRPKALLLAVLLVDYKDKAYVGERMKGENKRENKTKTGQGFS